MIDAIVRIALRYRAVILALTVALIALGGYSFTQLPIEAYPDVADTWVQIITQWPGHASEEVERQVTLPVELEMNGVPKMAFLRSTSLFGLSVVTLIFEDGTDSYFARQQVVERLQNVDLPDGVKANLGPLASPIGEIYRYVVRGPGYPLSELKAIEDWTIERYLRSVPGVADVISFGGTTKQYRVLVKPDRLAAHGLTLDDIASALDRSNKNAGGGFIEVGPQAVNVRGMGLIRSPQEIQQISVRTEANGTPILIRDVADVEIGHAPRLGIVGLNQDDDVVQAIVLMRKGEGAQEILDRVKVKVAELNNGVLPQNVKIESYYDRAKLIGTTTHTVLHNMLEGIALVAVILFVFLGNLRSSLIVAATIPLSLLFAFSCMNVAGIPANLLSIGAVDFGMIVDGAVVMVENVFRHLAEHEGDRTPKQTVSLIRKAATEVARPMVFSVSVIVMAYLPIFTLQRVEGKLFRPMAFTVAFALFGSLLLALTVAPVLSSYLLKHKLVEKENPLLAWRKTHYVRALKWALSHRFIVIGTALLIFAGSVVLAGHVGSEFLPHLDEGAIWVRASMPANISLSEAKALVPQIRRALIEFPEATIVSSQVGRPDDGTDPTGFYNAEFFVQLKDHSEWRPQFHKDKEKLIEAMATRLEKMPGIAFGFSQPISDNVEEATSGVKGQLAIKLYGPDLEKLDEFASVVGNEVKQVHGVADFGVLRELGQTNLAVEIDRSKAAQFAVDVDDIEDVIEAGVGGRAVSQIIEGEKRFDLVVRMSESARADIEALRRLLVGSHDGKLFPIGQLATLHYVSGASRIYRENNSRYIALKFSVRDRDLGSTVNEAQARVAATLKLPEGYRMFWSGEFESQRRAAKRLMIIVPVTLAGIVVLLMIALKSVRDALVLFLNVLLTSPVGGLVALKLVGAHLSVSSGVGFLALFGTSVQTGVILVSYFNQLRAEGMDPDEAILHGCQLRLRPVMMTALVATFGLLPAALSHAIGSDSQRPLAIVIVGGLLGSLVISLLLLPTLYRTFLSFWPDKTPGPESGAFDEPPPEPPHHGAGSKVPAALGVLLLVFLFGKVASAQTPAAASSASVASRPPTAESVEPPAVPSIRIENAMRRFQAGNLRLLASKSDLEAARADVIAAGLWTNPNVGANVSILSNGSPQGGAQTINLVVDQVVPMGGQTTLRRDVAQALSTAQEREFAALAFTLGADIEDAYLALQLAQKKDAESWPKRSGSR
jgi:cobalt-zinc-cadmium resistance protein CzcA